MNNIRWINRYPVLQRMENLLKYETRNRFSLERKHVV